MKRVKLIQILRQISRDKGLALTKVREGRHEIWAVGPQRIQIPRHLEIQEGTAAKIIKAARSVRPETETESET